MAGTEYIPSQDRKSFAPDEVKRWIRYGIENEFIDPDNKSDIRGWVRLLGDFDIKTMMLKQNTEEPISEIEDEEEVEESYPWSGRLDALGIAEDDKEDFDKAPEAMGRIPQDDKKDIVGIDEMDAVSWKRKNGLGVDLDPKKVGKSTTESVVKQKMYVLKEDCKPSISRRMFLILTENTK